VLASLGFPSFPGISGKLFTEAGERDASLAMVKAYNDWHILDWAGAHPGRFIPLAILPFWDPQEAAAEVRRTAKLGCRVVDFAQNVCSFGLPSIHDRYWDPLWTAMLDEDCVLAVHLGTGGGIGAMSRETPYSAYMSYVAIDMVKFASDVLFSPLLQRYPRLQIALSEGGVGWIPFFLERCEWIFERHSPWTHDDFGGRRPTDVFREHFLTCFIDDQVGVELRDKIGVDHISWECDYPHSDSTWPNSPEYLARSLGGVSREDADKMTHRNALRFFRSDALERVGHANATVAALRARSTVKDFGAPRVEGLAAPLAAGEKRQVTYYDLQRIMADSMPSGGQLGSSPAARP
jgi:predicted TIM-barrel fold metal-dependent hydrolase